MQSVFFLYSFGDGTFQELEKHLRQIASLKELTETLKGENKGLSEKMAHAQKEMKDQALHQGHNQGDYENKEAELRETKSALRVAEANFASLSREYSALKERVSQMQIQEAVEPAVANSKKSGTESLSQAHSHLILSNSRFLGQVGNDNTGQASTGNRAKGTFLGLSRLQLIFLTWFAVLHLTTAFVLYFEDEECSVALHEMASKGDGAPSPVSQVCEFSSSSIVPQSKH